MDQIIAFEKAGLTNHRNTIKEIAVAVRFAHHAKNKDFKEYIDKDEQKAVSKVIGNDQVTKGDINTLKSVLKGKK
jgi:O-acetylhomoserine/O-acetylserine sulfhydrylase-like pyridoxal-dependent enzyme